MLNFKEVIVLFVLLSLIFIVGCPPKKPSVMLGSLLIETAQKTYSFDNVDNVLVVAGPEDFWINIQLKNKKEQDMTINFDDFKNIKAKGNFVNRWMPCFRWKRWEIICLGWTQDEAPNLESSSYCYNKIFGISYKSYFGDNWGVMIDKELDDGQQN